MSGFGECAAGGGPYYSAEDAQTCLHALKDFLVPWALDVEFRSPMAIAVLGGLISSTFLSLLYIPAIFTIVDDIAGWGRRRIGKAVPGQHRMADEPAPVKPQPPVGAQPYLGD